MTRNVIVIAAVAGLAAASALAQVAPTGPAMSAHYKGEQLAAAARVSLDTARATALAARPGRITDQELKKERGGSGLRYSFDVQSNLGAFEVGVDAKTGKLLENAKEGAHTD